MSSSVRTGDRYRYSTALPSRPGWRRLPALAAALLVLVPMVYLAIRATEISAEALQTVLFQSRAPEYVLNTLVLGLAVSLAALVAGVSIAVGINRGRFPRARVWLVLSALPLAIPSYLASYGWLVVWPTLAGFGLAGFCSRR